VRRLIVQMQFRAQVSVSVYNTLGAAGSCGRSRWGEARVLTTGGSRLAIVLIMAVPNIVREARRRSGLTQEELAERAGVPKSTVGRIESGARVPSTEMVERLVQAAGWNLSVSLSEPDPGTDSMFERTLRRTPAERLSGATRAARFVLRGRRKISASDG
jgi:transcriptional regulator with XRE-family HTH domain